MPIGTTQNTLMKGDDPRVVKCDVDHINEHAFLAVNKNASLTDVAGEAPQQLPVGMGLHAGGDFWGKFEVELMAATSGVDPATRPAIVRELLQYMNMDTIHFTAGFNIMKLTIKKTVDGFGSYVFHIPNQHIKTGCFMSFVLYHNIVGNTDWWWCDNAVKGRWHQKTHHLFSGKAASTYHRGGKLSDLSRKHAAGAYTHVDIGISGKPTIGDVLYIALPQVIAGKWNPAHRCPQFYNVGAGLGT
ncbi:hypothetical protein SK355_07420 [Candidatus Fukatsuia symbiotica]|uniref:Uncharacterized protein n=1 Tax=Candidatus Fukatsuia symbiotica TaxID=1878942 RepID=A0A2U8I6N1_9GAMM|nr:hypothetical protein [Candidatus Fukatsuia symbiotica]AWK14757.1 hypothetical protein CCS41_10170 [Candidatus Fukatsuia symbiotica]MEA9445090.1 hypothetical protein [Candidatus Fukatsuia symbiotica]